VKGKDFLPFILLKIWRLVMWLRRKMLGLWVWNASKYIIMKFWVKRRLWFGKGRCIEIFGY
jgi:hypothetical protein